MKVKISNLNFDWKEKCGDDSLSQIGWVEIVVVSGVKVCVSGCGVCGICWFIFWCRGCVVIVGCSGWVIVWCRGCVIVGCSVWFIVGCNGCVIVWCRGCVIVWFNGWVTFWFRGCVIVWLRGVIRGWVRVCDIVCGCVRGGIVGVVGIIGVEGTAIGVEGINWCVCLGGESNSWRSRSRSLPGRQASSNDSTRSSVGPHLATPAVFCSQTTNVPCVARIFTSPLEKKRENFDKIR